MTEYAKYCDDNNKCMNFLVHHEKLLKLYSAIWYQISNLLEKGSDSEPVDDNK